MTKNCGQGLQIRTSGNHIKQAMENSQDVHTPTVAERERIREEKK